MKNRSITARFGFRISLLVWLVGAVLVNTSPLFMPTAFAQDGCSPFSPDCIPGGVSPPSGVCPAGQAPVGVCTVIICIEICEPTRSDPPPFTSGSGSASGGDSSGSGSSGSGSGGSGGSGSGGDAPAPKPYNFFLDDRQITNNDLATLHWSRTTGATPDGRPTDTISNAPLDGGTGSFMSAEGKSRAVAERQNYLRQVEGGFWTCDPIDDLETTSTRIQCEQASAYELPPGYVNVEGLGTFDGSYPLSPNKMTYRNWPEIYDGLTSGRLLDDPTNQTVILAGMVASAPAIYGLGAYGSPAVTLLLESPAQAAVEYSVKQQLMAVAGTAGVTLNTLVQTTSSALIKANNLTPEQAEIVDEMMEGVGRVLAGSSREQQVRLLTYIAETPYEHLLNYIKVPDQLVGLIETTAMYENYAALRPVLETQVLMQDLFSEDIRATALRTLSEQAVGTLSIDNPTLANMLKQNLPGQITNSLEFFQQMIEGEGFIPLDLRLQPENVENIVELGSDGISRMNVWITAVLRAIDSTGAIRTSYITTRLPVPVRPGGIVN